MHGTIVKITAQHVSVLWFKWGHTLTGYSHRTISQSHCLQDTRFYYYYYFYFFL